MIDHPQQSKRARTSPAYRAHGGFRNLNEEIKANLLYQRAETAWQRKDMRAAFRWFLAAAEAGLSAAFFVVGNFYDCGTGVKADKEAALYWYQRTWRCDRNSSAANNIGCIWRDRGEVRKALLWFHRAVEHGDGGANLEIAKVYLAKSKLAQAQEFMRQTCKSPWATDGSKEEAREMMKTLRSKSAKR